MIIADLEHLEIVSQTHEIQGGQLPIDPKLIIGKAVSLFTFNSLVSGAYGSFGGGVPEFLTTAFPGKTPLDPGNYNVGFKFSYAAVAIGIPLELAS